MSATKWLQFSEALDPSNVKVRARLASAQVACTCNHTVGFGDSLCLKYQVASGHFDAARSTLGQALA